MSEYKIPERFQWNYCGTCGAKLIVTDDGQASHPYCATCRRFYYYNPVPAACCFVDKPDGSLLFVRRAVEPCRGGWSLPGGFIELEETPVECVIRELHEETGLIGASPRLIGATSRGSRDKGSILVLGYIIEEWHGEENIFPATDAMELGFFPKDKRPELVFEMHRELLALYDADRGV